MINFLYGGGTNLNRNVVCVSILKLDAYLVMM